MPEKLKFAIVGCGSVSGNRYFPNLRSLDRAELVAVCDGVAERARPRAEEFGVPYYTDIDEMLGKADFSLLVNLTSNIMHYPLNLKGLQAGKNIYTQKPMTITVNESTRLIEEASRRQLKIVSECASPLYPYNQAIKRILDTGLIGKVLWARSRCTHVGSADQDAWPTDPTWKYKFGSGPFREVGIERLHLLTFLLGPCKRVTAMSGINQHEVVVRGGPMKGARIKVEEDDVTLVTMDFGDGIFSMLDNAWIKVRGIKTPDLEIYGEKGVICSTGGGPKGRDYLVELYRDDQAAGIRGWQQVDIVNPPYPRPAPPIQVVGLAHAIDCILDGSPNLLAAERARHCVEIIEKAFIAARSGITQTLETTC